MYMWASYNEGDMISTAKARDQFSDIINRARYRGERIILTRRGKPVAAVVPIEDLEVLEKMEDRIDVEEAEKRLASDEPRIPWEEVKRALDLE